jgi:lipoprotein NlpD
MTKESMNQFPRFAKTCPDMLVKLTRLAMPAALAACLLVAAGCTSRSLTRAPVEDRGTNARPVPAVVAEPVDVKQLPGFENAGKPGYYSVKPGDTMIRIGLENGQNWRDIVRWNNLENPNLIEVGQVLRVVPPASETQVVTRPVLPGSTTAATATPPLAPASRPASAPAAPVAAAPVATPPPVVAAPALTGDEDVGWIWPAQGTLLGGFDDAKNKGLDIGGRAGDAVIAAADGRVVYSGAGLRGYGNLIILKHNNTFLTAYAHNQTLLVKEDQAVKKGQKIAEMGNSDADRVKLHFEIRRQGKPVDPAKYLPPR